MALKITDKVNTSPVSGTYPYGNIKDDDGTGNGTAVNVVNHSDIHQFFARLAAITSTILNGLPDNAVNGWQLITALQALINSAVSSEASIRASADTALQNNKLSLNGSSQMTGNFNLGGFIAFNSAVPSAPDHLTRKDYTDSLVSIEASNRSSADTTLQNNINIEASTRGTNDTTLQGNITAEAVARANADTAISGGLLTSVFSIGDWNMDSAPSTFVSTGVAKAKIRGIDVIIYDDFGNPSPIDSNLDNTGAGGNRGGWIYNVGGSGEINLTRLTGGVFDNSGYHTTPYNRGFVTVRYIP